MEKKDGGWLGETVRGFEGWMLVSLAVVSAFLASARPSVASPHGARWAAIVIYTGFMVFQVAVSEPLALRVIALFAMGIPALTATVAWSQWSARATPLFEP